MDATSRSRIGSRRNDRMVASARRGAAGRTRARSNCRRGGRSMKVVILAGGYGTRLCEETISRPKPLVEIGGKPLLWHILNIYSAHGFREFVIACGYKGEMVKE